MQVGVIGGATPYGLPLNETTMAQHLQTLGYRRNIVGKVDLTLCYECFTRTAPSYLCDCLELYTPSYTLRSASGGSQPPKFSQLVPATFLFSVHLRGMTFPFLSDRNPLWTPSHQTWRHFFSQNCRPAMFSILCWCLHLSLHLCLLPVLSCV